MHLLRAFKAQVAHQVSHSKSNQTFPKDGKMLRSLVAAAAAAHSKSNQTFPKDGKMLRSLAAAAAAAAARLPAAAARRRLLHHGNSAGRSEEVESIVYRMSMLRAPPVVRRTGLTCNSCSLIGRLAAPVSQYKGSSEDGPRAYTFLSVPSSSSSSSSSSDFQVTLQLDGDLANICLKHLKQNDLVYVYGPLSSYHKVSASRQRCIIYKIFVKELNYVIDHNKKPGNDEDSADAALTPPDNTEILRENEYKDRLRLWQVFFASPYEWWDNRQSKPYISYPDFKHKDTREKLWLRPDDPPWVRNQLELHDLQIAENGGRDDRRRLTSYRWEAPDLDYSEFDERQKDELQVRHQAECKAY